MYEVGDLVYVIHSARKIGTSPKLQPVHNFQGSFTYSVDKKKSFVLHHDRLKPCKDRSIPLWLHRKQNKILNNLDQEDPENKDNFCLEWLFDNEPDNTDTSLPEYYQEEVQSFPDDQVLPESTLETEQQLDSGDQLPELKPSRCGRERRLCHLQDCI